MPVKIEKSNPYTIGFDLGNQTIASAVINSDFNVVRQHGEVMDHVNLFREGESKAQRRSYRSARRNNSHKSWLKKQLYRYFLKYQIDNNIAEVQQRFKTSWISKKDKQRLDRKSVKMLYLLQKNLYHNVWFAVKALIDNDKEHLPDDVRGREQLIYEVFHNLLNRRGHFLMPNLKVSAFQERSFDFDDLLFHLRDAVQDDLDLELGNNPEQFKHAMVIPAGIMKRKDALLKAIQNKNLTSVDKQRVKYLTTLCVGGKVSAKSLAKLFKLEHEPVSDLQFSASDVDKVLDALNSKLSDKDMAVIKIANRVYYQAQLSEIQRSGMSFVDTQIDNFERFGKDLVLLKKTILPNLVSEKDRIKYLDIVNRYLNSEDAVKTKYRKVFYQTGSSKKATSFKAISQIGFADAMTKLKKAKFKKPLDQLISKDDYDRLGSSRFLSKTRSIQNSWIPQQAIQSVIRQIIDSQKHVEGLEWLGMHEYANKWFPDEKYDLERFYDFRIPYFVGPLYNDAQYSKDDEQSSKFSWLKRHASGTLTVFNFTEKVDLIASARQFIANLQARDSYLLNESVMPASSMIYQRFALLDELNHLSLKRGSQFRKITFEQKMALFNLFKRNRTVSLIMAFQCLQSEFNVWPDVDAKVEAYKYLHGLSQESAKFAGNKAKFNSSLGTYLKWKNSYGFTDQEIHKHFDDFEEIAEILTVFDQNSKLIKESVLKKFDWLTAKQIELLSQDNLDGWGHLSKKLLTGIYDDDHNSVLDLMADTSMNLIQALAVPAIKKQISDHQEELLGRYKTRREAIDALLDRNYASPAVRKVIQRFASHLMGIIHRMRYMPSMVVIESARVDGVGQNNTARVSQQIDKLADEMDRSVRDEWKSLTDTEKKKLSLEQRLYFEQNGRDIYTAKPLDLNHLGATTNIDHVIPQRMYKDDSLMNKVLTLKDENLTKSGSLCAIQVVNRDGLRLWNRLCKSGLMSKAKCNNLRVNWNDSQNGRLAVGMLRRSLVETHQVNKLAAQVATMLLQNYGTKVLTIRAAVTTFLRKNTIFKDTKNRNANDLHHGVDAFLVAFAGQYLWRRYDYLHGILDYNNYSKIKLPPILIRKVGFGELFNGPDDGLIINKGTGEIVGQRGHLKSRLNQFNQNTINVRFEYGFPAIKDGGKIADATIYPARPFKKGQNYIPTQGSNPEIYGYRAKITNRKMVLIKLLNGYGKGMYSFISIPYNFEKRVNEYLHQQVKYDFRIVRDDLMVFDEFRIPGTKLRFAANGFYFYPHSELQYSLDLLKRINKKNQLDIDGLRGVIVDILEQIKKQYSYMIKNSLGANYKKLATLDLQVELAKENDKKHLKKVIDDLLIGYNCSRRNSPSIKIGDVKLSFVGLWPLQYWPSVEML